MRKIALLSVAVILTSFMAMAQQPGKRGERPNMDPTERANQMTEHMAKEYSLTDEQKEKLSAINLEFTQSMTPPEQAKSDADKKKSSEKDSDRRAEMQQKYEAYNAQLKEVLTDEQYEAYTKKEAERQKRGPRGGERGPRPERAE